ncbi:intraflagellar transport protein 46 homolog [Teleopsis dalmanni]|uniref:intraflagellar transport protein 46 homolog n=1 Tax=Teleopsis dalmanni TaxID=139649 RepID=UPI0018CE01C7|nr:intraflagellar transport protein 46 homolog [Teleopsis dalmanni]
MNFYDEEITIRGPDSKHLSNVKVERLPSRGASDVSNVADPGSSLTHKNRPSQRNILKLNSTEEDDGLLQDIIDHDDEDEDDDDEDDSDIQQAKALPLRNSGQLKRRSATQRPKNRPGSTRSNGAMNLPTAKALELDSDRSDTESDDIDLTHQKQHQQRSNSIGAHHAIGELAQLSITPDKWKNLDVPQELKELFPYILKYTPQSIETHYLLQPFIPEYVPAVGDVDAFLKVTVPTLPQPHRLQEINEHLSRLGLHFLDEPSGEQSEPSLLNMKLRSMLTGSGVNPRSTSATLIPTAKSSKDIDKWIAEVEQVHMTQSVYDAQPRKDIELLQLDWPRNYADAAAIIQSGYQRCANSEISLDEYICLLCQHFGVEGASETQIDYILNVHTLFALYLVANQAWD